MSIYEKNETMTYQYGWVYETQRAWFLIPTIVLEFGPIPGAWTFGFAFLCFAVGVGRDRIY